MSESKKKGKPKPLNPSGWRNDMSCIILTGHSELLQYNPSTAILTLAAVWAQTDSVME